MLSEYIQSLSYPYFTEIEKKTSVSVIIKFIKVQIINLPIICKKKSIINEDGITQELVILLNRNLDNLPFQFHHQYISKGKRQKVDVGVIETKDYLDSNSIFEIECKRLPTPGSGREKEYVQREKPGKIKKIKESGGMARFKKSLHAKNLPQCSLIGYIQENDFTYWFDTINKWIIEFTEINSSLWLIEDKLSELCEDDKVATCVSKNKRINNSTIIIHHLWIMMN